MDYQQMLNALEPYMGLFITILVIAGIISLIIYLCVSVWLRRMAMKVGVPASLAWLSFLPIGRAWIIGRISTKRYAYIYNPILEIIGYVIIAVLISQAVASITDLASAMEFLTSCLPWFIVWAIVATAVDLYVYYGVTQRFGKTSFFAPYLLLDIIAFLSVLTAQEKGLSNLWFLGRAVFTIWYLKTLYQMAWMDPVE